MTTVTHPYTGPCTVVLSLVGPHDSVRVLADRFGYFFVQYLYSAKNDHWRFLSGSADDMGHPRAYTSRKSAIARAHRAVAPRSN